MAAKYTRVNLRKTHPTMYRQIMVLALMRVALAFNFWFARPTFMPYGIHKTLAGLVFVALGASQLVYLHVFRDLRKIRAVIALSGFVEFVWGGVNCQQFLHGKASLQLPIFIVAIAVMQYILLIEPPVNPVASKVNSPVGEP